ncbi:MAG: molybdate ABC transporter substrate-binding protein [Actinomycetota bacterium]|nr:molybdate ABC transporter substrate-binding protein [Actinomycetota bacterium]
MTSPPTVPGLSGPLTIFAAASLSESFTDLRENLKASNRALSLTYSFAGSGALVAQVSQGAPADVIATADTASMKKLSDASLVEAPVTFARNKMEILVAPGNPRGIRGLADLARSDIKFVSEDETVPAGKYSAQALRRARVTVSPVSREVDVKSTVAKVVSGEADATIAYASDVKAAGTKAQGVEIPGLYNIVAEYPIAVVKATGNHRAATAFVEAVVGTRGQGALRAYGFMAGS